MKVHLNLATRDLNASVAYYSTLLAAKPMKKLADYALFATDTPGLELALDLDPSAHRCARTTLRSRGRLGGSRRRTDRAPT